jgi:hypothetical protein
VPPGSYSSRAAPSHFLTRGSASGFAIFFAAFLHFTHVTCWIFVS